MAPSKGITPSNVVERNAPELKFTKKVRAMARRSLPDLRTSVIVVNGI